MQTLFYRRKSETGGYEFVPGEVITKVRGVVNVCFQEQLAEPGAEIDLFHRKTDNFMRQAYVVVEITPTGVDFFMKLRKIGVPVYAGFRWAQRVPTPGDEITADLGEETGLQVLDISETGLSVESNIENALGTTMNLHFHFNRLHLEGDVTVVPLRAALRAGVGEDRAGADAAEDRGGTAGQAARDLGPRSSVEPSGRTAAESEPAPLTVGAVGPAILT
jgi:hypothetical protein